MQAVERVVSHVRVSRPVTRAITAIIGMLLAAGLVAVAWGAFVGSSTTSTQEPSTAPAAPVVATIDIGHGGGIDVEVGEGGVWVTTPEAVLEVDPATNQVVKEIRIDAPFLLDIGEGSLWVTESIQGALLRIDPNLGTVLATIAIPTGAYDVDVAAGVVWVTAGGRNGGRLVRIDPTTNAIVASIHVGRGSGAGGLGSVVADENAVWVTRGGRHDSLVRIDPTTNRIAEVIDIPNPDYWDEIALEADYLWVATAPHVTLEDGTRTGAVHLLRIDPSTNEVAPKLLIGHGMFGLGAGDGSLWLYDGFTNGLTHVDAATRTIVGRVDIPDGGSSWGGDPGIDAADGTVWMTGMTSLIRVDLHPVVAS